jgi:hypothetical protein
MQAYVFGGCLSPTRHPALMSFRPADMFGGLDDNMDEAHADVIRSIPEGKHESSISVQCFPLMDLLDALRVGNFQLFQGDN